MNQTTGATTNSKYETPKNWDEINDAEKIERMREIIKDLRYALNYTQDELRTLKSEFRKHGHQGDRLVRPIEDIPMGIDMAANSLNKQSSQEGGVFF